MWDFLFVILFVIFVCDFCLEAVSLGAICLLWVFPLTFLLSRPRYGFSRLFSYFHAQFPLPDISISFRGGLFCLLFTPYAHAVGFLAYFFCSHAQFSFPDYMIIFRDGFSRLFLFSQAHVVGFPAYFSTSTPSFYSGTT